MATAVNRGNLGQVVKAPCANKGMSSPPPSTAHVLELIRVKLAVHEPARAGLDGSTAPHWLVAGYATVATIGLDIAKSVFQVHGVDAAGQVVTRRKLKRRNVLAFFQNLSPCLVGIEACASSHYWARELQALGHTVR
jgi:transposase